MSENPAARTLYTYSTEAVKSELGITDSGWINLIDDENGTVRYRKVGSIVEIRGYFKPDKSGTRFTIGILPEGYRPVDDSAVAVLPNSDHSKFFALHVQVDGHVLIKSGVSYQLNSGTNYNLHIQYFVD